MNFLTRNLSDLKDGEIIKDGQAIRVPVMLMDSADPAALAALRSLSDSAPQAMHRPGQLAMTDDDQAVRSAAHKDRIERMNDAWRNPAPQEQKSAPQADTKPDPAAALAARNAALADRWKKGGV